MFDILISSNVFLKPNTSIKAKEGDCAFDVCWWPKGYQNGTQVVINTTGKIDGNIEIGDLYEVTDAQKKDIKSTVKYFSSSNEINGCYIKDNAIYYYDEKIIELKDIKYHKGMMLNGDSTIAETYDYLVENNIVSYNSIAKNACADGIVLRVYDRQQAMQVLDFINENCVDYAEVADHIFVHGYIPCWAHLDNFRDAALNERLRTFITREKGGINFSTLHIGSGIVQDGV